MTQLISHPVNQHMNLHLIPEKKFKTYLVKICFQRPLAKEEVTVNALLPFVLKRGTQQYPTLDAISKKLEGLYGASLEVNVTKKGERQLIDFILNMADMRYLEDKSLLVEGVRLLNQMIYHPAQEGENGLVKDYVQQEAKNLINRIESRSNNKNQYALERCVEEMCYHEPYGLYEGGRIEDFAAIDEKKLFDHHQRLVKTTSPDIIVVGDLAIDQLKEVFQKEFTPHPKESILIPREQIYFSAKQVKKVTESMDVNQGKLTLGYRTNTPFEAPEYTAMMFLNNLMAGGAHSRLFKEIREKNSLCYYIYSRLEKFKSILLLTCGIEINQYEAALELIQRQIRDLQAGNITEIEMDSTRQAMVNWIKGMKDSSTGLADYYQTQLIGVELITPEEMIERVHRVTKEEVVAASNRLQLDTIYFLKNQEN